MLQPTLNPDSSHMMQDIVLLDRYPALVAAAGAQSKAYQIGDVVAVRCVTRVIPPYHGKLTIRDRAHTLQLSCESILARDQAPDRHARFHRAYTRASCRAISPRATRSLLDRRGRAISFKGQQRVRTGPAWTRHRAGRLDPLATEVRTPCSS